MAEASLSGAGPSRLNWGKPGLSTRPDPDRPRSSSTVEGDEYPRHRAAVQGRDELPEALGSGVALRDAGEYPPRGRGTRASAGHLGDHRDVGVGERADPGIQHGGSRTSCIESGRSTQAVAQSLAVRAETRIPGDRRRSAQKSDASIAFHTA